MSLSIRTSRLALDLLHSPVNDRIAVEAWRGNPLLVPLSLWDNGAVADLSDVTLLKMIVLEEPDSTTILMEDSKSSFSSDDGSGTGSCCVFDFTSLETSLATTLWTAPQTYVDLHVWIYALQADDEIKTIARGKLSMYWDGNPGELTPPDIVDPSYLTSAAANARFVRFDTAQSLTNDQLWQALNNLGITYDESQGALLLNLPTANGGTQVRITLDAVP